MCSTQVSTAWRSSSDGTCDGIMLCNGCGLHVSKNPGKYVWDSGSQGVVAKPPLVIDAWPSLSSLRAKYPDEVLRPDWQLLQKYYHDHKLFFVSDEAMYPGPGAVRIGPFLPETVVHEFLQSTGRYDSLDEALDDKAFHIAFQIMAKVERPPNAASLQCVMPQQD